MRNNPFALAIDGSNDTGLYKMNPVKRCWESVDYQYMTGESKGEMAPSIAVVIRW